MKKFEDKLLPTCNMTSQVLITFLLIINSYVMTKKAGKNDANPLFPIITPPQINLPEIIIVAFSFIIWLIVLQWMCKYMQSLPP